MHVEALAPTGMVFGGGAFGRLLDLDKVVSPGPRGGISALVNSTQQGKALLGHQERAAVCQSGRRGARLQLTPNLLAPWSRASQPTDGEK